MPSATLLMPSLAGLFGIANLIDIYVTTSEMPKQEPNWDLPPMKPLAIPTFLSAVVSSVMAILPGMTAAQATVVVMSMRNIAGRLRDPNFIPADFEYSPSNRDMTPDEMLAERRRLFLEEVGGVPIEIEEEVIEIQSLIFAIFSIFKAFLALGLIVGIAGLGVVTMRSVSERQHQTGVLRALGFDKGMVLFGYVLELTWISLLGMINGVLVAILFHYQLYRVFWEEQGAKFTMPWLEIFVYVFGAYLLVLLFTALPIRKASQVPPAEALRQVV